MINNYLQIIMNNKIQKGQTSETPGAKAGYCAWALHTAPPKGSADLLSHPIPPSQSADPFPTFTHYRSQAALSGSQQGPCYLFSLSCCRRSPSEALPEFLIWPLINSYWNFCWLQSKDPSQTKRFCRLTEDLGVDLLTFTRSLIHTLTRWIFECLLTLLRCTVIGAWGPVGELIRFDIFLELTYVIHFTYWEASLSQHEDDNANLQKSMRVLD